MPEILSVNTIMFTILGYPMSYIEFVGTIFYLWSVWLVTRRNILNWPVGMVSVLLYMVLFYQIQLYSDTIEQVYFLGASVYGWAVWGREGQGKTVSVGFGSRRSILWWAVGTLGLSLLLGDLMSRIHLLLPGIFPVAASFPLVDALTTVMSFSAMWLMAQKKTESWIYWIILDAIGIWLYFVKDVRFLSLLYVILLGMAINGLRQWLRGDADET